MTLIDCLIVGMPVVVAIAVVAWLVHLSNRG